MSKDRCPFAGEIPQRAIDSMAIVIKAYRELEALDPSNELLKCLQIDWDKKGFSVNELYVQRFVEPDEIERFMDASNWNWEVRIKAYERCTKTLTEAVSALKGGVSPATKTIEKYGISPDSVIGFDRVEGRYITAGEIFCVEQPDAYGKDLKEDK